MRSHLEDRGKNVWRAKVYAGRQSDGRRVYVTRTIHGTKRFAESKLAELLMEVSHTDEVTTDGTLAALVQQWRPIAEVNLSPTTLHEYDRLLEKRILPRFATLHGFVVWSEMTMSRGWRSKGSDPGSCGSARYAVVEQLAAPTDTLICSPGDT